MIKVQNQEELDRLILSDPTNTSVLGPTIEYARADHKPGPIIPSLYTMYVVQNQIDRSIMVDDYLEVGLFDIHEGGPLINQEEAHIYLDLLMKFEKWDLLERAFHHENRMKEKSFYDWMLKDVSSEFYHLYHHLLMQVSRDDFLDVKLRIAVERFQWFRVQRFLHRIPELKLIRDYLPSLLHSLFSKVNLSTLKYEELRTYLVTAIYLEDARSMARIIRFSLENPTKFQFTIDDWTERFSESFRADIAEEFFDIREMLEDGDIDDAFANVPIPILKDYYIFHAEDDQKEALHNYLEGIIREDNLYTRDDIDVMKPIVQKVIEMADASLIVDILSNMEWFTTMFRWSEFFKLLSKEVFVEVYRMLFDEEFPLLRVRQVLEEIPHDFTREYLKRVDPKNDYVYRMIVGSIQNDLLQINDIDELNMETRYYFRTFGIYPPESLLHRLDEELRDEIVEQHTYIRPLTRLQHRSTLPTLQLIRPKRVYKTV